MTSTCRCALTFAILLVLSITTTGCDEDTVVVPPPDHGSSLSGNLQSNCYSWPEQEFSPENVVALQAALPAGSAAVEFSLEDLEGNVHQLSELLKSKPVLLVLGSFT
jgi:hypothetical protein